MSLGWCQYLRFKWIQIVSSINSSILDLNGLKSLVDLLMMYYKIELDWIIELYYNIYLYIYISRSYDLFMGIATLDGGVDRLRAVEWNRFRSWSDQGRKIPIHAPAKISPSIMETCLALRMNMVCIYSKFHPI